jgi:hypothetical protein
VHHKLHPEGHVQRLEIFIIRPPSSQGLETFVSRAGDIFKRLTQATRENRSLSHLKTNSEPA